MNPDIIYIEIIDAVVDKPIALVGEGTMVLDSLLDNIEEDIFKLKVTEVKETYEEIIFNYGSDVAYSFDKSDYAFDSTRKYALRLKHMVSYFRQLQKELENPKKRFKHILKILRKESRLEILSGVCYGTLAYCLMGLAAKALGNNFLFTLISGLFVLGIGSYVIIKELKLVKKALKQSQKLKDPLLEIEETEEETEITNVLKKTIIDLLEKIKLEINELKEEEAKWLFQAKLENIFSEYQTNVDAQIDNILNSKYLLNHGDIDKLLFNRLVKLDFEINEYIRRKNSISQLINDETFQDFKNDVYEENVERVRKSNL